MLALSHHIVVQWAAWRSGVLNWRYRWFKGYMVLGDDIVIFDPYVADQYHFIMTKLLKVKINLAKSVSCRNGLTLEFAKKY